MSRSLALATIRSLTSNKRTRRSFSTTINSQHAKCENTVKGEFTQAFKYTSGRWLYNEAQRLDERNFSFNISALIEAAAHSVGQTTADVQSFGKLAEFNRIFELTMRDGVQITARLPYPLTQPRRLAVASEVATMDLVRSHGVPVPKVFGYSADAANAIGAEYILMEKVCGRPLGEVWFNMSEAQRSKVLSAIVEGEAKLFAIEMPANGSVFYDDDLPRSMERIALPQKTSTTRALCVGPDVSLRFWYEKRSDLTIQRKPFVRPRDVLLGAATKEMAWLKAYGKPRMPFERIYRDITDFQKSDPLEHMQSLQSFTEIATHLVPKDEGLCKPTLRHPDLNPHNIMISEDFDVVGMIDWQHSKALPLFLHAGIPAHFQNYGDAQSEELIKPQYPTDLDEMDEDEREQELEQYRRRHVHFYYSGATATRNEHHFDALMHEGSLFRRKLYEHVAEPWEGNNIPLKADLIRLARYWPDIVSRENGKGDPRPSCPLSFDEEESETTLQGELKQEEVDGQMEILRNVVGAGSDGWVSNDRYDEAFAVAARMKAQALHDADDDFERENIMKYWPFDDFDENE